MPPLSEAEQNGVDFFKYLGVSSLKEARAIDEKTLLQKIHDYRGWWGTTLDNLFCVGEPLPLFCQGKRIPCPVMMGHTDSEFFVKPQTESVSDFKAMAKEAFGANADEFLKLFDTEKASGEELVKEATFPSIELGIRAAIKTNKSAPIYYYSFGAEIPGWDNPGTFHSVDLWFFFETLAKCWRPFVGKHYDLARQMCTYWANFVKSGNPNGKDASGAPLPEWDACTEEKPARMNFADISEQEIKQPTALMSFAVKEYIKRL